MSATKRLALLVLSCSSLFAQSSRNISIETVNLRVTGSMVAKIDFENFEYPVAFERGSAKRTVLLRGGRIATATQTREEYELVNIWKFQTLHGPTAIVSLLQTAVGGSSSQNYLIYVFTQDSMGTRLLQFLNMDAQVPGSGVAFDPQHRMLTVRGRLEDESPHCCPTELEIVSYRWSDDGRFVLHEIHREPVPEEYK